MKNEIVCVIGLGYVGLPLAVSLGMNNKVIGIDKSSIKISQLKSGKDPSGEVSPTELKNSANLIYSSSINDAKEATTYIVCVPTPVDDHNVPDLSILEGACKEISTVLNEGDLVIIESTVYPGVTNDICRPILLKNPKECNFLLGYSPERINPGDASHSLKNVTKVISGCSKESLKRIHSIYSQVVDADLYEATSIEVAEASKVIENCQRDINIAFVNELSLLFDKLDLSTKDVLAAASTKWNFLQFSPGLVGGHCISVDPYYLTHLAAKHNYHPEVILAGRRINDGMGIHIAQKVINNILTNLSSNTKKSVLILGATFKENCSDIRNSRCLDIINFLNKYDVDVSLYDPNITNEHVKNWNVEFLNLIYDKRNFDSIIFAVNHSNYDNDIHKIIENTARDGAYIFDVKNQLSRTDIINKGFQYDSL